MNQDYCFLWINHWSTCMTKSEWSSWIQAIGSISAILLSVIIVKWQDNKSRRSHEKIANQKAIEFIEDLKSTHLKFAGLPYIAPDIIHTYRSVLNALVNDAVIIKTEYLSDERSGAIKSMKLFCVEFLQILSSYEVGFRNATVERHLDLEKFWKVDAKTYFNAILEKSKIMKYSD